MVPPILIIKGLELDGVEVLPLVPRQRAAVAKGLQPRVVVAEVLAIRRLELDGVEVILLVPRQGVALAARRLELDGVGVIPLLPRQGAALAARTNGVVGTELVTTRKRLQEPDVRNMVLAKKSESDKKAKVCTGRWKETHKEVKSKLPYSF